VGSFNLPPLQKLRQPCVDNFRIFVGVGMSDAVHEVEFNLWYQLQNPLVVSVGHPPVPPTQDQHGWGTLLNHPAECILRWPGCALEKHGPARC